jgi:uncharacterized protein YkwD
VSHRSPRRLLATLAAVLALSTVLAPGFAQPAAARDGATFVDLVNGYRADAGVAPVSLHRVIDKISVERANQLAKADELVHDMEYVKKRLAQEDVCWERLGEIIAWNTRPESERVERFVVQWYNSEGHRAIMLGPAYTHTGGSWTTSSSGRHYAAMVFVKICGATAQPMTYGGFTDIADSEFRDDIVWIAEAGITRGCSATRFCPDLVVRRDQMATFLARAMGLASASKDWFTDDDDNSHHGRINRVAEARVTKGCAKTKFCPDTRVSRAQMASFLARALSLPPTGKDYFSDDNGSDHEDAINRLAAAGITKGCAKTKYCPTNKLKREQMAAFLRRAFD